MRNDIKKELLKKCYIPYFQPIIGKDEIVYECLARVMVKNKIISPSDFIHIAKEMNVYEDLTKTMIEESFKYFTNKKITFSINLNYRDISNKNIIIFLEKNIVKYGIGKYLIIEILEDEIIDFQRVKNFIGVIRIYGVRIALDDFGSASSNLKHLVCFEPEYIKLDGFFIKDILTKPKTKIIVQNIVLLAKELKIKIIAEYVESNEIYQYLASLDIDYFQGFYFGKPAISTSHQNNKLFYKKLQNTKGIN